MNLPNFLRHRLSLLVAVLAVVAMALAGPHQPAAQATCVNAAFIFYYSDATYTTQVGYCHHDCCQLWTCTGTLTNYSTVTEFVCDFN